MTDSINDLKNYHSPYRGIPPEVRLFIWDYAIPKNIPLHLRTSLGPILKPSKEISTYFSLILVSKEVRGEAFAVSDRKVVFDVHHLRYGEVHTAWKKLSPSMIRMIKAVQISLYDRITIATSYTIRSHNTLACVATLSHVPELHVYIDGDIWLNNATVEYEKRSGGRPRIDATGFVAGYGCKIQDQSNKVQKALFKSSGPSFHGDPSTRAWPFHLLWDLLGAVAQSHVDKVRIHSDHLDRHQCSLLQEEFESFLQIYHSQHLKKHLVHMRTNFPRQETLLDGSRNEGEMVIQRI